MESEVAAWLRDNDLLCLDAVLRDAGYDDLPDLRALCGDAPALCSLVPAAAVRMKLRRLMLQKAHPYYNVTSPRPPLSACLATEDEAPPPPRSWPALAPALASRRPSSSGSSRDSRASGVGEMPLRTQRQRHRQQQQRQDYYVDCPSSVATGSPRPAAAVAAALGESCLLLPDDDADVPPPSPPAPGTAAIFNHAAGMRRAPLPSVYASAAPAFTGSARPSYALHAAAAAPDAPLAIRAPAPLATQSLDGRRVHALRAAHRTLTSPAASPLVRLPSSAAARTTSSAAARHRSLLDHPGNSVHAPPSPPASPPAPLSLPPSRHTSRLRRPSTVSSGTAPTTTRRRNSTMSPPAPVRARGVDGGASTAAAAANTATTPSARRRTAVSPPAPAKPGVSAAKLAKARSGGARSPPPPVDARGAGGKGGGGGTVLENGYKATLVLEGGRRVASFGWVPRDDDSLHFISDAGTTVVKLASVRTVHADERRCGCTLQLHDGRTVAFEVHEASYHAALLHKLRGLLGRSVHVGHGADRPSPPSPSLAIPSPLAGLDCP